MTTRSIRMAVVTCVTFAWAGTVCGEEKVTVDDLAKPFVEKHPTLGLVVGIVTPEGSQVFGYGTVTLDGKTGTPGGDTLFEIGSVTKTLTGVLLADMTREGIAHPDDPVKKHLPEDWDVPRVDDRDIRLLHLTTHTSSLPVQPPELPLFASLKKKADNPYSVYKEENLKKMLGKLKLKHPIGSRYDYSNLGAGLLGEALWRTAKVKSYEALLVERIADPLGMSDTRIDLDDAHRARLAPPHNATGKPTEPWDFGCLHGCGGVRSTANDLIRYLKANLDQMEMPLKESLKMAQRPWREIPGDRAYVGFGWHIQDSIVWHNGGTGGYASYVAFDPKLGTGVVVLCNGPIRDVDQIGDVVLGRLE